jgi:prepilin-type N-terminal cleavage/methylation domain-containing protein/prepilin-type processing-associated H-X9-DG protein
MKTPSPHLKPARRGFTLIELLVVIAIIALLAAILFPVFARARENARKSSCQNNLKQLGIGIAQYVQDFDETMPQIWGGNTFVYNWAPAQFPYVKSYQVYRCPSNSRDAASGYLANNWLAYKALADIQKVSGVVYLIDGYTGQGGCRSPNQTGCFNGLNEDYTLWNATRRITNPANGTPRHLGAANVLYCDGHVKSVNIPTWVGASQVATLESVLPYGTAIYEGTANTWVDQ